MYLYSASLQTHMSQYMKDVQLQLLNDEYQQMSLALLKETQMMGLSPYETMQKLNSIPNFNTNAPEVMRDSGVEQKSQFVMPSPVSVESPKQKINRLRAESQATTMSTNGSPSSSSRNNSPKDLHVATSTKQLKELYKEKNITWPYGNRTLTRAKINEDLSKFANT